MWKEYQKNRKPPKHKWKSARVTVVEVWFGLFGFCVLFVCLLIVFDYFETVTAKVRIAYFCLEENHGFSEWI